MIESIRIAGVATYGSTPQTMSGLSRFNYVFGSNATGKTTISRLIADEAQFSTCSLTWSGGTKLQPMVYNHDFVEKNFNQAEELKGVFTLGEMQVDTRDKIERAKADLDALTARIENLNQGLQGADGMGGKKGELAKLQLYFRDKCWAQKQKHDAKLQGAFEGFRNDKEKFKNKVLQEQASNTASLQTQAYLENRSESVFGQTPTTESPIASVEIAKLITHETNPILKKRVIGKEDVNIAAMIKKLGNSDWVRQGRGFYDVNDGACPFCQQRTTVEFATSLNEYFDETFVKDSKEIDDLAADYETDAARVQQQLAAIIAVQSKFLNVEKLKAEKELLDTKITLNKQRLAGKKNEASQIVELESVSNVATAIKNLISAANAQISDHNKIVTNLATERAALTSQVWKFVLEELKTDLADYKKEKEGLDKAIDSMTAQIAQAQTDKTTKEADIRELEKTITSVQPTIDGINQLLAAFGFQGFTLARGGSGTSYKLVRADGTDAKTTLSEGEKAFITFLYFYHLLKGSDSESGMTTDRIVVFDDPVSSLDSDILFIVGSLIKGLFDEVRSGTGHIKQIFILTHNVYFHKEVTYCANRSNNGRLSDETFWIVRKFGLASIIENHLTNPIKTSYDLLWAEVRDPSRSNLGIQNVLRRILENYFKILGGYNYDRLCDQFDGRERLICKSLVSWVHDGSHNALDDLYISIEDSTVENYLQVFRKIFENSGHLAHYKMMMGDAFVEDTAVVAGS